MESVDQLGQRHVSCAEGGRLFKKTGLEISADVVRPLHRQTRTPWKRGCTMAPLDLTWWTQHCGQIYNLTGKVEVTPRIDIFDAITREPVSL